MSVTSLLFWCVFSVLDVSNVVTHVHARVRSTTTSGVSISSDHVSNSCESLKKMDAPIGDVDSPDSNFDVEPIDPVDLPVSAAEAAFHASHQESDHWTLAISVASALLVAIPLGAWLLRQRGGSSAPQPGPTRCSKPPAPADAADNNENEQKTAAAGDREDETQSPAAEESAGAAPAAVSPAKEEKEAPIAPEKAVESEVPRVERSHALAAAEEAPAPAAKTVAAQSQAAASAPANKKSSERAAVLAERQAARRSQRAGGARLRGGAQGPQASGGGSGPLPIDSSSDSDSGDAEKKAPQPTRRGGGRIGRAGFGSQQ